MFFHQVAEGQPDPVFGLSAAFEADIRKNKVDLLVGIYKDEHLRAPIFPTVKRVKVGEERGDYLPMDGLYEFRERLKNFVFGEGAGHVYVAQTLGGTGALRIGAELVAQEVGGRIAIPEPTWPNHRHIFERAGCEVATYPYYDRKKRRFDFAGLCAALKGLPEKTVVVFHAACHNPSGVDPKREQWQEIASVCRAGRLLPFFDCAYQGLGEGLRQDLEAIRVFREEGLEMLIAYSCSKNFSLYCQRVGALFVVAKNSGEKERIGSQVRKIIRGSYSNPPAYGARIVAEILGSEELKREWEGDVEKVRERIVTIRKKFVERLCQKGDFGYLQDRKGLFMFLELEKTAILRLREERGVYILDSGRMNVAGLTDQNLDYVVESIGSVVR